MVDKILGGKEVKKQRGLGIGRILHGDIEITNICDSTGESVSLELELQGQGSDWGL